MVVPQPSMVLIQLWIIWRHLLHTHRTNQSTLDNIHNVACSMNGEYYSTFASASKAGIHLLSFRNNWYALAKSKKMPLLCLAITLTHVNRCCEKSNQNVLYFPTSCNYTMSQQSVSPLASYNFDAHEWILIFSGRNVTDKVGNQKTLFYTTSNNLCFCTIWQNRETRK